MKIKLSKSQWEEIGRKANWQNRQQKPFDSQLTKFNLNVHQLLEFSNLKTMLEYIKEIETKSGQSDQTQALKEFIANLIVSSKKIKHMVQEYEKNLNIGERQEIPQGIDVGESSYETSQRIKEINNGGFRHQENSTASKKINITKTSNTGRIIQEAFWRISRGEDKQAVLSQMGIKDPAMITQLDFLLSKNKGIKHDQLPTAFK